MLDNQRYTLVGSADYTRADGQPSKLLTFESGCPDCGATFQVMSGLVAKSLTRRCEAHRASRRPVNGRLRDRVAVKVIYPNGSNEGGER